MEDVEGGEARGPEEEAGVGGDQRKGGVDHLREGDAGMLEDGSELAKAGATEDEISEANGGEGEIAANASGEGGIVAAEEMFEEGEERSEEEGWLLGKNGEEEAHGGEEAIANRGAAGVEDEGNEAEQGGFQIRDGSDPIDGFCVDGMKSEEGGGEDRGGGVVEEGFGGVVEGDNDESVEENVEEVEAEGEAAEQLPQDEVGEGHERAVVVGGACIAHEGPDGGGEDLREIAPAFDVRIGEDLELVVVNEGVEQGVGVEGDAEDKEGGNGDGVEAGRGGGLWCGSGGESGMKSV